MVIGTIVGLGVYGSVGVLLIMKFGQNQILAWAYILFLLSLILYHYWKDTQVRIIKTGLAKKENLDLLKEVFKRLNWGLHIYANEIGIEDNKYILKFVSATIIYSDNEIACNFKYTSSSKSGRPAFFLGISSYLRNKFDKKLETVMHESSE
jgi:hypothetical protein